MRTRDFISSASTTHSTINYDCFARRLIEQRFGARSRKVSLPHIADCYDLTPDRFRSLGLFQLALRERRAWCKQYGFGGYSIETIGDATNVEGLRFRFANGSCAALFRLLHTTDLQMPPTDAGK